MGRRGRQDVEIGIKADIAEYAAEVGKIPGVTEKEAAKAAKRFQAQIKRGQIKAALEAKKAAKDSAIVWADEFANVTKGIGTGFAIAFGAIAGAAKATAEINEARSEMINLSAATDIALDTLAGVEAAAGRAGVPVSEVIGSFEDFGEVLFDFSQGGGRAKEALELMGFEASDMDAAMADVDGTLRKVVKQMTEMEEGGKKTAVAQQLFGDSGNRLNAILKDGALEDYIALAETYGTVINEEAIQATMDWNSAVADFKGVLGGTTTGLVDFLDLSSSLEGFTQVFLFFREVASGIFRELTVNVQEFDHALSAVLHGDITAVFRALGKNVSEMGDEFREINHEAALTTLEFMKQSEALKGTATDAELAKEEIANLAQEEREAAAAAKLAKQAEAAAAKARSKWAAEELADAKEIAKEKEAERKKAEAYGNKQVAAIEQLNQIIKDSTADQQSGADLIQSALNDRLFALLEIEKVIGLTGVTQLAQDEARALAIRQLDEIEMQGDLALKEAAKEQRDKDEADAADAHAKLTKNYELGLSMFQNLGSAATAAIDIRMAALQSEAELQRSIFEENATLTAEAIEQLHESTSEAERLKNLERVRELGAEEDASAAVLAIKQRESNRLFGARKAIEIATIIGSGASAAIAAYVPPPVGAGPIFGSALAATIAAATAGQIAIVGAQRAPQFDAGFPGFTQGPDNFAATLRSGEAVLNQGASERLGSDTINDLNAGGSGAGRSTEVVVRVGTRDLGRVMVEEMGAGRELDREMQKRTGRRAGVRPVYRGR